MLLQLLSAASNCRNLLFLAAGASTPPSDSSSLRLLLPQRFWVGLSFLYLLKLLNVGASGWIRMGPGMLDFMVATRSSSPFMARSHGDT